MTLGRKFIRWGAAIVLTLFIGAALAHPAVGILYQRQSNGDLTSLCTISIVAGEDVDVDAEYALVTAAHCVRRDLKFDDASGEWRDNADWLVTFDEKSFTAVVTYRVGDTNLGYDLAVLVFDGPAPDVEPLRLGEWADVKLGERVINWANPLGIGLQRFEGYVSMLSLERPVKGANIWWKGNSVAIIAGAGGSSGSLILNEEDEVVGVLIGVIQSSFGSPFVVFVPVSKFADFLENDTYGRPITQ